MTSCGGCEISPPQNWFSRRVKRVTLFCSYFTILLDFLLACASWKSVNVFNSISSLCWFLIFIFIFCPKEAGDMENYPTAHSRVMKACMFLQQWATEERVLFHPPLVGLWILGTFSPPRTTSDIIKNSPPGTRKPDTARSKTRHNQSTPWSVKQSAGEKDNNPLKNMIRLFGSKTTELLFFSIQYVGWLDVSFFSLYNSSVSLSSSECLTPRLFVLDCPEKRR